MPSRAQTEETPPVPTEAGAFSLLSRVCGISHHPAVLVWEETQVGVVKRDASFLIQDCNYLNPPLLHI